MAKSIWELLAGGAKNAVTQKTAQVSSALKAPKPNPYLTAAPAADLAQSKLGQQQPTLQSATPQQVLSPSGQRRYQEEKKVLETPFYKNAAPLIEGATNEAYNFFKTQEDLAKPIRRNTGEGNADYAYRTTVGNFLPKVASQGYKAAEYVVPELRTATVVPNAIGQASNAFLPSKVSGLVTPVAQAYSVLRSPNKWAALGNLGIDYGTDAISQLTTGKTLNQNIDESSLPDYGKGLLKTGYNIASGLLGAKLGNKAGKYVGDVGKAAREAAPAIAEGRRVYNETGDFDKAIEAITEKNLELQRSLTGKTGESEVQGFRQVAPSYEAPKVVDQKFRTDKLNLGNEAEIKKINDRIGDLGLTTRNVRSFDEVKQLAQELGADPKKLLANSRQLSDADVVALRNTINQNADFLAKNRDTKFEDPTQNAIHQTKLNAADAQINQALKKLIGGGTEAGRTVASFKILANKTMDPAFWYQKAQKSRGNELSTEHKATIDKLIGNNDRAGLAMYVAGLRNPSGWEKFSTLWKAGLLTNIPTHVANVAGNAGMAVTKGIADTVGTGIDKGISLFTGKRTKTVSPIEAIKGLGSGAKKGLDYLRTGTNADELAGKSDIQGEINFGDGALGKAANVYTRGVFRSLGAEDAVFKGLHERGSLSNQAKLIAINEGLKGKEYNARVEELLAKPTDEMKAQALDDAKVATFNNDNILASKIAGLKAGRNKDDSLGSKVFGTVVDVAIPFVKTPTNVVSRISEYTPLGLLKLAAGQISKKTRGQKRLVDDLSKVVTGSTILAIGGALADKGLITGTIPSSTKERDQWQAEGKQPNSIKIGGKWYQLNKIAPVGYLLGLAADYKESGGDVATTAFKGAKNLTDQTFLTGLSGGLKAVTDPEQNAKAYLKQTVSSVIPAGIGGVARIVDPTARVSDGVLDAVKARVPGLSQSLAPRIDIFGEEVKNEGGLGRLLDPFGTKTDKSNDPVLAEVRKQGIDLGLPSNRMFNTALDTHEFAQYQQIQGKVLKQALQAVINSPAYKNASASDKQKFIDSTVTEVRSETKDAVFPQILQKRFNLPTTIDPNVLNEIANELYQNEDFSGLSLEKQRQIILAVVEKI